jgi:pimeloyl-ACP methyl ester carboxylesterase
MPYAVNGQCSLYYETFGDPANSTLLLINGMTSQCIFYPIEWCELFAGGGLHVIRMDNRDVGLSSDCTGIEYRLTDMASDCCAVLDACNVAAAHIHGLSLGGMIAQTLAIMHPQRVLSLTSVMSSTGEPEYRRSDPAVSALLTAPSPTTPQEYIDQHVAGLRAYGSPAFADENRWVKDATAAVERSFRPDGPSRQFAAAVASGSREVGLRSLRVPTLVMHGSHDTLIYPLAGRRTAALIPGARFVLLNGLGHDYPPQMWPLWTATVLDHIERASNTRL